MANCNSPIAESITFRSRSIDAAASGRIIARWSSRRLSRNAIHPRRLHRVGDETERARIAHRDRRIDRDAMRRTKQDDREHRSRSERTSASRCRAESSAASAAPGSSSETTFSCSIRVRIDGHRSSTGPGSVRRFPEAHRHPLSRVTSSKHHAQREMRLELDATFRGHCAVGERWRSSSVRWRSSFMDRAPS